MAKSLLIFACLADARQRGLSAAKVSPVVSDNRKAIASKPLGDRRAKAFAGASDENCPAHEGTWSLVLAKRAASSLGRNTVSRASAMGFSFPRRETLHSNAPICSS